MSMGVHYEPLPPYEPNLNAAESAINRTMMVARANLAMSNAPEKYLPFAVSTACYVHHRSATTAVRGERTPYELITGIVPDVSHLRPFMSSGYAKLGREKLHAMKRSKTPLPISCTGLPVLLLGYQSMYSSTHALLTSRGRVIHSRSAAFDVDAPLGVHRDLVGPRSSPAPSPFPVTVEFSGVPSKEASVEVNDPPNDDAVNNMPDDLEEAQPEEAQVEEAQPEGVMEDVHVQIDDNVLFEALDYARLVPSMPDTHGTISSENMVEGPRTRGWQSTPFINDSHAQANDDSRRSAVTSLFSLTSQIPETNLGQHGRIAQAMAAISMKDMSWKQALRGEDAILATQAFQAEYDALTKRILTRLDPGSTRYKQAVLEAVPGRVLLDRKRNGTYKARMVKQGFKENKEALDGADFTYYQGRSGIFSPACGSMIKLSEGD